MKLEIVQSARVGEGRERSPEVLLVDEEDFVVAYVQRTEHAPVLAHSPQMLNFIARMAMSTCGHRILGGFEDGCFICDARRILLSIEGSETARLN